MIRCDQVFFGNVSMTGRRWGAISAVPTGRDSNTHNRTRRCNARLLSNVLRTIFVPVLAQSSCGRIKASYENF
jgi:hypothetical protein